jgi:uncharacterized membrane protein
MSDVGPPVSSPSPESPSEGPAAVTASKGGPFRETWLILRNRVLSGLFLALPLLVTAFVIKWTYDLLSENLIAPIARLVLRWWDTTQLVQAESWVVNALAPIVAIVLILSTLFLLGMFFRSRIHRLMDWVLLQVPVVRTIYSAVVKVIDSIQRSGPSPQFQRVVLVEFPHPGMKVPGFVTSSCIDRLTGKKILCVYCPTTPVPTSGYMLLVPEEDVFDISWDVQDTVQAIVSGGISIPQFVEYYSPRELAELRSPEAPRSIP